jgi:BlaI family penicillinase repressor
MAGMRFGAVQLRIMRVLWARGRANAREITEELNRESPIAHSTVQTLLRKLERKGAITHDIQERTFVFRVLIKADNVVKSVSREVIERMLDGSAGDLVCYLLKHERISKSELKQIRKLINERGKSK